jgi:hypothetical protein
MVANQTYHNGWDPQTANFTSTYNLQYTPDQVDMMSGLMHTAYTQSAATIQAIIESYMNS